MRKSEYYTHMVLLLYIHMSCKVNKVQARIQKFFKRGGWGGKFLEEKRLLIHVSAHVHIKTIDKHATLSLFLLFKRFVFYNVLCFITLFYFWNLKGGGGCNPRKPPLDPPMMLYSRPAMKFQFYCVHNIDDFLWHKCVLHVKTMSNALSNSNTELLW